MVYTLSDLNDNVFYVGSTIKPLATRLSQHVHKAKFDLEKSKKAQKIKELNLQVKINAIDENGDKEDEWINWFKERGIELTNKVPGRRHDLTKFDKAAIVGHWRNGASIISISINTGITCQRIEDVLNTFIARKLKAA